MQLQTRYVIHARKKEMEKLDSEVDISKFKSANVAGMFVNPFEEYRPQTAFEFVLVRVLELFENFYGTKFEVHDHVGNGEVEDHLKLYTPNLEHLKTNSAILQQCVKSNNFKALHNTSWIGSAPAINKQLLVTWLGQSCTFVQLLGVNFLTDPIMSDFLINKSMGPKRLVKSPMSLQDVRYASNGKLDFVLVSHDHPDHLEMDVVKQIGNQSTWIVPLGLKKKLARKGVYKVIEMDWWDTIPINEYIGDLPDKYEILCVPAMHWSGRYVLDSNKSLWCSFIIRRNGESLVYHAGDTGFSKDLFTVIGKKYGPTMLGLLPIGQYCPSWHQKPRHISPEEALEICKSLSVKFMKGIHWGTFKLSSEPILEPKFKLASIAKESGKDENYRTPDFGITYMYDLGTGQETELKVD